MAVPPKGPGKSGKPLDSVEPGGLPVPHWPEIRITKMPSLSTQWVAESNVDDTHIRACRRWKWLAIWSLEKQAKALESRVQILRIDL